MPLSFITLPSLKNSNQAGEQEDITINISNISLIRPFPRSFDRSSVWIHGVENSQIILLPPAKIVELIEAKTTLVAGVSFIGVEETKTKK